MLASKGPKLITDPNQPSPNQFLLNNSPDPNQVAQLDRSQQQDQFQLLQELNQNVLKQHWQGNPVNKF